MAVGSDGGDYFFIMAADENTKELLKGSKQLPFILLKDISLEEAGKNAAELGERWP